jgi:hypothetical protein
VVFKSGTCFSSKIRAVGKMLNLTKRQRKEKDEDTDSFASLEDGECAMLLLFLSFYIMFFSAQ